MKGIPEVKVVVGRNDLQTAFDLYDPVTRTRIAVYFDCTARGGAVRTHLHSPVYGARAYRMEVSPGRVGLSVRYPRCAGWSEGFGSTQR